MLLNHLCMFYFTVEMITNYTVGTLPLAHRSEPPLPSHKHCSSLSPGAPCIVDVTTETFDQIVMDDEQVRSHQRVFSIKCRIWEFWIFFSPQYKSVEEIEHFSLLLHKKATIHRVTTMLATFKNVLFPGHNHLLITGADDPILWLSPERQHGC